jgi:hypothetical protein
VPVTTPTKQSADFAIRPRRNAWDVLREATGLASDAHLADTIGVAETTAYRVLTGVVEPSARFIAHTLHAFPFASFDSLFEVIRK